MSDSTHDTSWDIEKYRCEYEPTNHWNLRKKFMELHKDKYPEGRLVSLAQLFINITCLGCSYPEQAMQLVSELAKDVIDHFCDEPDIKIPKTGEATSNVAKSSYFANKIAQARIQFVSAQSTRIDDNYYDTGSNTINSSSESCDNLLNNGDMGEDMDVGNSSMTQTSSYTNKVHKIKKKPLHTKYSDSEVLKLFDLNQEESTKLHSIAQCLKKQPLFDFEPQPGGQMKWICMCRIDDLTVEGTGFNKKEAKSLAVKKALVEWKKSLLKKLDGDSVNVEDNKQESCVVDSEITNDESMDINNERNSCETEPLVNLKISLSDVQVVLKMFEENNNGPEKLHTIAKYLKLLYKFEFVSTSGSEKTWKCNCTFADNTIQGIGLTKKIAKNDAVDKVLVALKNTLLNKLNNSSNSIIVDSDSQDAKSASNDEVEGVVLTKNYIVQCLNIDDAKKFKINDYIDIKCTNTRNLREALEMFNNKDEGFLKLHAICQHIRMTFKYEFVAPTNGKMYWHCKCVLSDVTVHGFGNSKKNAKYEAVDIALIALKSTLAKKLNVRSISNQSDRELINYIYRIEKLNATVAPKPVAPKPLTIKKQRPTYVQSTEISNLREALTLFDMYGEDSAKLQEITQCINVPFSFSNESMIDNQMKFVYQCSFADIVVSGTGYTRKEAKDDTLTNTLIELKKYILSKLKNRYTNSNRHQNSNNNYVMKRSEPRIVTQPLVLLIRANNLLNYSAMLFEAVSYTKQVLSFKSDKTLEGKTEVSVYIDEKYIEKGVGDNTKEAKEIACRRSFSALQRKCYTLKINYPYYSSTIIDMSHVMDCLSTGSKKIEDGNIGNRLLKMMGWQGGGLGKEQQGIADPIQTRIQFERQGLGHIGENDDFQTKIEKLYERFIQATSDDDLVFSNTFTKEQREYMHKLAQKLGLKSHSYGTGSQRQLVISIKKKPWEIVQEILNGRRSNKYELIYPQMLTKD